MSVFSNTDVHKKSEVYTRLKSLTKSRDETDAFVMACMDISIVEELDSVMLTESERLAAALLMSFMSKYTDAVMNGNIDTNTRRTGT